MKKITAVVIGYGQRGSTYARYAVDNPDEFQVVAVADATAAKRATAKQLHNLSDDRVFADWKDLAAQPKMADFAIVSTQDNMHCAPALALIDKGYHLLLEKPVAQTPEECIAIAQAAEKKGVSVLVCHVLRYTVFYQQIKRLIDEGVIGKVQSIEALEDWARRAEKLRSDAVAAGADLPQITYVVELTGIDDALSDNISIGETLIDAAKKMNIGTIVAVETQPYVYLGKNLTDGTMELTTVDNKSTVYVTVEADATLTGISYSISGYDIYVGEKVYLSLPDFTGTGYCISLKAYS